jgi:hypothetical protein
MDDNHQPVSLHRLYTVIKERTKNTDKVKQELCMMPHEITWETQNAIANCKIQNIS